MLPLLANADTTKNLLNQDFSTWSGTNTARHGNNIVAGVHGQYVETEVKLSDTLTEDQIKWGWTSTLGADIYHWNNNTSETEMIQTITASDGTVTTQSRKITLDTYQPFTTYTDSHTETRNGNTDYTIDVRFNFSESTQSPYHWAVDLEKPTLVIEYEPNPVFLSSTQTAKIKSVVDDVEEIKIEEYKFEEVKVDIKEEIKVEEVKFEEEIKLDEKEFVEKNIVLSTELNNDDIIQEDEKTTELNNDDIIQEEVYEEEVVKETERDTRVGEDTGGAVETEPTRISESTQDDSRGVETELTIEEISIKVAEKIKTIDGQLKAVQILTAKAMQKPSKINKYAQVNSDIFIQPELQSIDIGTYTNNTYVDIRNIYSNQSYEDRLWTSRQ